MEWHYNPYMLPLMAATLLSLLTAWYAWQHRTAPGTTAFLLADLSAMVWSLGYIGELGEHNLAQSLFWAGFKCLGIVSLPVCWLVFVLHYTGQGRWLTRYRPAMLATIPALTLFFVWTNPWHELIWRDISLDTSGPFVILVKTYGPWFWLSVAFTYAALAVAGALLIRNLWRSPPPYRGQSAALLIGALIPLVGNILYVFGLSPVRGLDFSPLNFSLSGVAIAWGVFRYHLLDLVPLARGAVIESMRDGLVVLDPQQRVVDLNPAAVRIVGLGVREALGRPVSQVIPGYPSTMTEPNSLGRIELTLGEGEPRKQVELRWSPLLDARRRQSGHLVTLEDISEHKQAEQALQESEQQYRTLFASAQRQAKEAALLDQVRSALAKELDLPTVFRKVVEAIATAFGYTQVSIYLLQGGTLVCQHAVGYEHVITHIPITQGVIGRTVRSGKSTFLGDVRTDPEFLQAIGGIVSEVCIPLFDQERIVGALNVESTNKTELTEADLHLMEALGEHVGIAIGRARLYTEVRESEHFVQRILDSTPNLLYIYDLVEQRNIYINREITRFLGYSAEEVLRMGPDMRNLGHPDDAAKIAAHHARFATAGEQDVLELEYRMSHANGEWHWLHSRDVLFSRAADGTPRLILGAAEDITERRRAEQALHESEERYRELVERQGEGVSIVDGELGFSFSNPAADSIFGAPPGELVGRNVREFLDADNLKIILEETERRRSGQVSTYELEIARPDGEKRSLLVTGTPRRDQAGQFIGTFAVFRDVTERKLLEEALRASEANYRTIFDVANDAIFVLDDRTGDLLDVNQKGLAMFDYSLEDLRAVGLEGLSVGIPPYTTEAAIERIAQASTSPQLFEWLARSKSGGRVWVEANLQRATVGGQERILAVVRDISERKRIEEQLVQSQKMQIVGQLAGGVAHDFNNLLTAIIGYSELAKESLQDPSQVGEDLEEILKAAHRAAQLTAQLLAFSRRQVIAPQVIDLNELVFNMEKMLRRLISENIELVKLPGEHLGMVMVDRGKIEQVIVNLAVNARDAMPNGGRLVIETMNARLEGSYPELRLDSTPGDYVMIAISDTGAGMSQEVQQHLFEPFFTTKEVGKGTGLGLATVYGIVKQHGGDIYVYSELGKGTVFRVYLPRVPDQGQTTELREAAQDLPGGREGA